jgi:6,7-dimethyl-8-ribityllumazine synthase
MRDRHPTPAVPPEVAAGLQIAVITASWHAPITDALLAGALQALEDLDVVAPTTVRVPGAFELPVAATQLARSGLDALVCLGTIIRGETAHFDVLCHAVAIGLTEVTTRTGVPIGFGVLTCDDAEQAAQRARAGGGRANKGYDAAWAAVATASNLRSADWSARPARRPS